MRDAFVKALLAHAADPKFVFLTGDLGFGALEPLRDAMGNRFINCGVAEQNMVGVAAGLAKEGMRPWVYSIAPFLYSRAHEQIRNDVCLHNLPVVLVGNGGGYGYGVMGATHHALEDYGTIGALPNTKVYIPAFASDLEAMVNTLMAASYPCYLRLGRSESSGPTYVRDEGVRRLLVGFNKTVIIVAGPIAGLLHDRLWSLPFTDRPMLFYVCELPVYCSEEIEAEMRNASHLVVVEEHGKTASVGQAIAAALMEFGGQFPDRFTHICAKGYPSGTYGSQAFHRKECGLDIESILEVIKR